LPVRVLVVLVLTPHIRRNKVQWVMRIQLPNTSLGDRAASVVSVHQYLVCPPYRTFPTCITYATHKTRLGILARNCRRAPILPYLKPHPQHHT
jgi:hypothetical protein